MPTFCIFVCVCECVRLLYVSPCAFGSFLFVYLLARSYGQCMCIVVNIFAFSLDYLIVLIPFYFVCHFFRSNFICLTTKSCFGFTDKFHRIPTWPFLLFEHNFSFCVRFSSEFVRAFSNFFFLLTFFIFLSCFCFHLPLISSLGVAFVTISLEKTHRQNI